jgi:hypothetical protein
MVKLLALMNNLILVTQIDEVTSELGEPDCKLTKPFVIKKPELPVLDSTLEPFLCGYTNEDVFMISSDKILTITEPKPTLLEKYQELIK